MNQLSLPPLWMGVRAWPDRCRILAQDETGPILKARLPAKAQHPRALACLAEGLALWHARPTNVVVGVAAQDAMCVGPRWDPTVEAWPNTPLLALTLIIGEPRPPRRADGLKGLGYFDEVRQLRLWAIQP
jgi:hypothetical protein